MKKEKYCIAISFDDDDDDIWYPIENLVFDSKDKANKKIDELLEEQKDSKKLIGDFHILEIYSLDDCFIKSKFQVGDKVIYNYDETNSTYEVGTIKEVKQNYNSYTGQDFYYYLGLYEDDEDFPFNEDELDTIESLREKLDKSYQGILEKINSLKEIKM